MMMSKRWVIFHWEIEWDVKGKKFRRNRKNSKKMYLSDSKWREKLRMF